MNYDQNLHEKGACHRWLLMASLKPKLGMRKLRVNSRNIAERPAEVKLNIRDVRMLGELRQHRLRKAAENSELLKIQSQYVSIWWLHNVPGHQLSVACCIEMGVFGVVPRLSSVSTGPRKGCKCQSSGASQRACL